MKRKTLLKMLREYSTINYRELFYSCNIICLILLGTFTGNQNVRVNWKAMAQSPNEFFSPDSVPAGFVWDDPSHLQIEKVHELLDLWYARQDEGKVGLEFTGCPTKDFIKSDQRRKSRVDPEADEEEEDAQGKGKAPAAVTRSSKDALDENAPFSMIHKPAEDRISYLKTLSVDQDYLKMVDALASSDKVFYSIKIPIKWC